MRKVSYALGALIAAVFMAAVLVSTIQPAQAQSFPRFPVGWLLAQRLTVSTISTLSGNVTTGADVTVGGDLVVTGDGDVGLDLALGGFLRSAPTVVTYTTGALTPVGRIQPVVITASRSLTNVTVLPAGTEVTFYNAGLVTYTLTFSDATPLRLGGNRALGQYDTLTLYSDGTQWIETSFTNN